VIQGSCGNLRSAWVTSTYVVHCTTSDKNLGVWNSLRLPDCHRHPKKVLQISSSCKFGHICETTTALYWHILNFLAPTYLPWS